MIEFLPIALNIVLLIFLASCAIDAVLKAVAIARPESVQPAERNQMDSLVASVTARPGLSILVQFLELPAYALAWPVLTSLSLSGLGRRTNRHWYAGLALKPTHARIAVFLVTLLVIVTAINLAGLAWPLLLTILTWSVLGSVVCKEVSYLVSPLPDRLRQSTAPPWPMFLVVAMADAAALTLAVANLRSAADDRAAVGTQIVPSFLDLINVPDNITSLLGLNVVGIPIAIIGLLYSTAMIKTLISFSHFKRTDEDHVRLAALSVLAGNVDDSIRWIAKVGQQDTASRVVRLEIALASGDLNRANAEAGRVLVAQEDPDTSDRRLAIMHFMVLLLPLTEDRTLDFLHYFIANASDAALSTLLPDAIAEYPYLVTAADDAVSEDAAPLAYAVLLRLRGDFDGASAVLERTRPGSELEEVMRLVLMGTVHLLNPDTSLEQDGEYAREWWRSSWPAIVALSPQVPAADQLILLGEFLRLEFALSLLDEGETDESPLSTEFRPLLVEVHELANGLGTPEMVARGRKYLRKSAALAQRAL